MRLERGLRLGIASGLVLQILATLVGVLLLGRLAPAIEHIVTESAAPLAAIGRAQAILLEAEPKPEAVAEALAAVGDPQLSALALRVIHGEPGARLAAQRALVTLNRQQLSTLRAADVRVQSGARAGAWTLVVLGVLGVTLGLLAVRRSEQILVAPLARLSRAAEAWRAGDSLVRPDTSDMPAELLTLTAVFNQLLDALDERERWNAAGADALHAGLLGLLERLPTASVLLDAKGRTLAANLAGLDHLQAVEAAHPKAPEGWQASPLRDGVLLVSQG